MNVVIDTSILIDHLRGGNQWETFTGSLGDGVVCYLPTIVLFELFSGESTSQKNITSKITDFIKFFEKIELTETIARRAGEIYRDGVRGLAVPDYIVSASALEFGAMVATLNRKHFSRVPGLTLYPLKN